MKSPSNNGIMRGHSYSYRPCLIITLIACCFLMSSSILYSSEKVTKKLPIKGDVFQIEGRTAFLILPSKTKVTHRTPWVWYAPTLKGLPGQEEKWMFEKFLNNGIAIAGIDVGESFGSPEGRAFYSVFHKHLVEKRNMTEKACLLARSRGGLMLYNWAVENPNSVSCVVGIYPVCNLMSYPGLARACGAYKMTKEELAEKLADHNPISRITPLVKAKVPIFQIHGDIDKVVPIELNSDIIARRYQELGGKMSLKVIKGQGHNMWSGWFKDQELVDFVIKHGKQ